jgi:hypothetical protein
VAIHGNLRMIAVRNARCRATSASPGGVGSLFAELGNAVGEPGDFPTGGVAMHDAGARGTDEGRLGFSHGGHGRSAITGRDCLLDFAHRAAHAGTPRLIDHGAAGDLTGGLLRGFCISHGVSDETC